ncbi:hypothetical protein D3C80_1933030 [compost metagenome]
MAAGKPIISTKIKDVVTDYSDCVSLIENASQFCDAISKSSVESQENNVAYKQILANTSWDATVDKMSTIIKRQHYEKY